MLRFSDDVHVVPARTVPQVFSVPQLRMHLGVSDASRDVQKIAVAKWLESNPASTALRRSIVEEGWSDLLHLSA